jgi:hypothetical protein
VSTLLPLSLLLVLAAAAGVAALLLLRRRPRAGAGAVQRPETTAWRPSVQHREIPPPAEDPVVAWHAPDVDAIRTGAPPLAEAAIPSALRAGLDGYALGRVKRVLEAPDLLQHAAADPESWPLVEATVERALALAQERGVLLDAKGRPALSRALALCTAQGVLLAEWRQLEDGKTAWEGDAARVRASDAFAVQRLAEAMTRRVLPDLFAGIARRSPAFEVTLLVPYCVAQGFTARLHGDPTRAFAA